MILEFCFPQKVPTATANSTLLGARHALEEINADPAYPFQLRARHINPAGELAAYSEAVSTFIAHGIRHIFGTITSASRKEIIPDWSSITCCCGMAVLTRGSRAASRSYIWAVVEPDSAATPAAGAGYVRKSLWLIGSNYVWGWESNRIAREVVEGSGGTVVGEKYLHLRNSNVTELIEAILSTEVDFVLNNTVGETSYAFLRALDEACLRDRRTLAVLSCNFTEAEVAEVAPLRAVRLLSCGPFLRASISIFARGSTCNMAHSASPTTISAAGGQ